MTNESKKMAKSDDIKTPKFLASFPYCVTGKVSDKVDKITGKALIKYELTALFPKATTNLSAIKEAISAVAKKEFGEACVVSKLSIPLKDGDEPNELGIVQESTKGHWVMKTHTWVKPTVYLYNTNTVATDPDSLKPGDIMTAIVSFNAFDMPQKRGVTAILKCAIKLAEGNGLPGVNSGKDYSSAFADDIASSSTADSGLGF